MKKTNYLKQTDGAITYHPCGEGEYLSVVPAGVYDLELKPVGMMQSVAQFRPIEQKDSLINFKGSIMERIVKKCDDFFSQRTIDIYKELKICHKMGVILHGVPGTGKTCCSMLVMMEIAKKYDAICIDITKMGFGIVKSVIKMIREHQNNPILIFSDEFDNVVRNYEYELLPFMDGNDSVDGLIMLGCTNYIDKIPDRIKDRKSRVKHLFEIKKLPMAVYTEYITDRLPSLGKNISKFSYLAEEAGLTLDQVKNAMIDYKLEGVRMEVAIQSSKSVESLDYSPSDLQEEEGEDNDPFDN